MTSWKRDAASGLVVLVPIIITLWVVYWLYNTVAALPLLDQSVTNPLQRVVLTLVVFVLLVFAIGYLMRTALGGVVERLIDDLVNRLPGLRVVYNASKMAIETALSGTEELQQPVKLETWDGLRMTAFKTGKTTDDGRDIVFLPTSPNITTGFVIEVDPEDVTETDERVEDALTRVLSAGFGENSERGIPIDVTEAGEGQDRPTGADDGTAPAGTTADSTGGDGGGGDADPAASAEAADGDD